MEFLHKLLFTVVVTFTLIHKSSSIYCYYCNSANNSACLDLEQFEDEVRARVIPVVHCESAVPSAVAAQFFCRKIQQTIYLPRREPEVRITRGCGWVASPRDCYQANNRDHLETVCQCFHDHCNAGVIITPALTVFAVLFYLLRLM